MGKLAKIEYLSEDIKNLSKQLVTKGLDKENKFNNFMFSYGQPNCVFKAPLQCVGKNLKFHRKSELERDNRQANNMETILRANGFNLIPEVTILVDEEKYTNLCFEYENTDVRFKNWWKTASIKDKKEWAEKGRSRHWFSLDYYDPWRKLKFGHNGDNYHGKIFEAARTGNNEIIDYIQLFKDEIRYKYLREVVDLKVEIMWDFDILNPLKIKELETIISRAKTYPLYSEPQIPDNVDIYLKQQFLEDNVDVLWIIDQAHFSKGIPLGSIWMTEGRKWPDLKNKIREMENALKSL